MKKAKKPEAKKLTKSKKSMFVFYAAMASFSLFLLLPAMFSDQPAKILLSDSDEVGGSLPVVISRNPLSQYLKKAASFYDFNKKGGSAFGRARGVLPPPPEQDYTDEERAELLASYAKAKIARPDAANAESCPPESAGNGIIVQPDNKGYYYDGKYYKNGAYPGTDPALKKSIENSIFNFHEAQAQKQGKHAAYILQDDGSLIVKYLPEKEFEAMRRGMFSSDGGSALNDGSGNNNFYAKYAGAKIASRNSSGGRESLSRGGSAGGREAGGTFGDVPTAYGVAKRRFADMQAAGGAVSWQGGGSADTASRRAEQQRRAEEIRTRREEARKFVENLKEFDKETFYQPRRAGTGRGEGNVFPLKYTDTFNGLPAYVDEKLLFGQLGFLDIAINDCKNARIVDLHKENTLTQIKTSEEPVKVFDGSGGFQTFMNLGYAPSDLRQEPKNVFFNFLSVPAYDPSKPASYTDIYYRDTGLKDMLYQMEVNPSKISAIEKGYSDLDKNSAAIRGEIMKLLDKNPSLKKLDVEIYYILGKEGDKIMVATINSPLYAANRGTVPAGADYRPQDGRMYTDVTMRQLGIAFNDPDKIITAFAVDDNGKDTTIGKFKLNGVTKEELSSIAPQDLAALQKKRGQAVMDAIKQKADAATLRKIEEGAKQVQQNVKAAKEQTGAGAAAVKEAVDNIDK